MTYTPRLKQKYNSEIVNKLKGNYKSVMQVPKLVKISLNQGVGNESTDKKFIDTAQQEMSAIAGQKALVTKSKKDISNFKVRKGMPVGVMVTLRGDKMYEFLDRLISATLPRVRDFKGVPKKGFDGRGNYTLGIKEHIVFQEIDLDKINKITGMDITIVTTAKDKKTIYALLEALKSPSDIAAILAATRIASVPVASSGAWKSIHPITSFAAKSISPVWRVKRNGWTAPVATLFMKRPSSGS